MRLNKVLRLTVLLVSLDAASLALAQPLAVAQEVTEDRAKFLRALRTLWMNWGYPGKPPLSFDPAPDAQNAASRYLWLWRRVDEHTAQLASYIDLDAETFSVYENEEGVTTEDLRSALREQQDWIQAVVAATGLDECDFNVNPTSRSWPFEDHDPRHGVLLSGPRRAARILAADAVRLAAEDEKAAALERSAAVVRLALHLASKEVPLMHHLVADAILNYGLAVSDRIVGMAKLNETELKPLRQALALIEPQDPAGVRRAWNRTRVENADFVRNQLNSPHIGGQLLREIGVLNSLQEILAPFFGRLQQNVPFHEALPQTRNQWSIAELVHGELAGLTVEECESALEMAKALGDVVDIIWEREEAPQLIRGLELAIEGDSTSVGSLILHSPRALHRSWRESTKKVAALRQKLGIHP